MANVKQTQSFKENSGRIHDMSWHLLYFSQWMCSLFSCQLCQKELVFQTESKLFGSCTDFWQSTYLPWLIKVYGVFNLSEKEKKKIKEVQRIIHWLMPKLKCHSLEILYTIFQLHYGSMLLIAARIHTVWWLSPSVASFPLFAAFPAITAWMFSLAAIWLRWTSTWAVRKLWRLSQIIQRC